MNVKNRILELHHLGRTQRSIAGELLISPATVNYWINHGTEERKKTGRPRKTTSVMDTLIFVTSYTNPFISSTEIIHTLGLPVKKNTVIRRLKEKGLNSYRPAIKEKLTSAHIQSRLEFAERYRNWTFENWKQVVFTDEKVFSTFGNGHNRVWRTKRKNRFDKKYLNIIQRSGRKSIPVWACICATEGHNHIYYIRNGNLTGVHYRNRILWNFIPAFENANLTFMHDRSPIHTSHVAINYLHNTRNINILDWPAKAPDLNPIENLWAEMERRTCTRHVKTEQELWETVNQTFEDLAATDYITKLIQSMPRRLEKVIEARGHWTKY